MKQLLKKTIFSFDILILTQFIGIFEILKNYHISIDLSQILNIKTLLL